jgi:hypothetical protein
MEKVWKTYEKNDSEQPQYARAFILRIGFMQWWEFIH